MSNNSPFNTTNVAFADAYIDHDTGTSQEATVDTFISYEEWKGKEGYGSIEERSDDASISRPVEDVTELDVEAHLTAEIAAYNRKVNPPMIELSNGAGRIKQTFDEAVLAAIDLAFEKEDVSIDPSTVSPIMVNALVIREARDLSYRDTYQHLKSQTRTKRAVGLEDNASPPTKSPLHSAMREIESAIDSVAFENAVKRAVHSAFLRGCDIPQSTSDKYEFIIDLSDTIQAVDETEIDKWIRRVALRNWIRELLEETMDPLFFRSDGGGKIPVRLYLGVIARSARVGGGVDDATDLAKYHYPDDNVPTGNGFTETVRDMELSEINDIFLEVIKNQIEYFKRLDFFPESVDVACDPTWVDWTGDNIDIAIGHAKRTNVDSEEGIRHIVQSTMGLESRFILGVQIVKTKDKYPERIEKILKEMKGHLPIRRLFADAEFDGEPTISAIRRQMGRHWVVGARIDNSLKKAIERTEPGERSILHGKIDYIKPSPQLAVHPIEKTGQQTFDLFGDEFVDTGEGSNTSNKVGYLTDLSEQEVSAKDIHDDYQDRQSVEEAIKQTFNHFYPVAQTGNWQIRLFWANLAAVLVNWHTLINRAPSPKLKLRLDVTHNELLTALEDVVLGPGKQEGPQT